MLNRAVLALNASYEPVNVLSAKRALTLVLGGKAVVEKLSGFVVRTSKLTIPIPLVIRFIVYRCVPRLNRAVSRKGILLRDASTCQYCQFKFPARQLTLDHVIPRSKGGASTWENLVACCFACNNRKDSRTPSEAGMALARQPKQITILAKHRLLVGDDPAFNSYLFR